MRIEQAELRLIQMRLVRPFQTSLWRETTKEAIIVSLFGEGAIGYGECVAGTGPWYSYETVETAWHILAGFLVPLVLGEELEAGGAWEKMQAVRGHHMAKAALDEALWDLQAKLNKTSLAKSLGGVKDEIESGISIGIQEGIPKLLGEIERRLEEGYPRVKLKIKPGWDLAILEEVRERFPQIRLQVDANAAYTLNDLSLLEELDQFNLLLIEQPLAHDDLADHARLQRRLRTPICLDESIASFNMAKAALALGSCRVINIKPGRVGGLGPSIMIHDYCHERDIPVWCGGMLETGVGRAHNVALAALPGFILPNDVSASSRYWEQDLVEPEFVLNHNGTISVPRGAGIGVEVLEERLEEVTVRVRRFNRT